MSGKRMKQLRRDGLRAKAGYEDYNKGDRFRPMRGSRTVPVVADESTPMVKVRDDNQAIFYKPPRVKESRSKYAKHS